MKNKDLKKGKESIIGKIIYGFLLFMPLLAIGVTCLTNFFNKEDSVEVIEKYETNEVNNYQTDLVRGRIYHFTYTNLVNTNGQYQITASEIYNFNINQHYSANTSSDASYYFLLDLRTNSMTIRDQNYSSIVTQQLTSNDLPFEFDFVFYSLISNIDLSQYMTIEESNFNITETIAKNPRENVFYRAVDKVEESSLFNWAENSLIYTGISNTCTQLAITNTFIPLLLSYWLIISVIYILYDIILMILIILHNKIHQIQDAI